MYHCPVNLSLLFFPHVIFYCSSCPVLSYPVLFCSVCGQKNTTKREESTLITPERGAIPVKIGLSSSSNGRLREASIKEPQTSIHTRAHLTRCRREVFGSCSSLCFRPPPSIHQDDKTVRKAPVSGDNRGLEGSMPCSREVGEVGICSAFNDQGSCGLAMSARCERRACGRVTVCKEYCSVCEKKFPLLWYMRGTRCPVLRGVGGNAWIADKAKR